MAAFHTAPVPPPITDPATALSTVAGDPEAAAVIWQIAVMAVAAARRAGSANVTGPAFASQPTTAAQALPANGDNL